MTQRREHELTIYIDGSFAAPLTQLETTLESIRQLTPVKGHSVRAVLAGGKAMDSVDWVPCGGGQALAALLADESSNFTTLLRPGDRLSDNYLKQLVRSEEIYPDLSAAAVSAVLDDETPYILNENLDGSELVSILRQSNRIWLNPIGTAFRAAEVAHVLGNSPSLPTYDWGAALLLELAASCGSYVRSSSASVTMIAPLEDQPEENNAIYEPEWYFGHLDWWSSFFQRQKEANGRVIRYFQNAFLYQLRWRFQVNLSNWDKHVLSGSRYEDYRVRLNQALKSIDDALLLDNSRNWCQMGPNLRFWLLRSKYGEENQPISYQFLRHEIGVVFHNRTAFSAATTRLKIFLMDREGDKLLISGVFPFPMDEEQLRLTAEYAGTTYPVRPVERYSYYTLFGQAIYTNFAFDVEIPLSLPKEKQELRFYAEGRNSRVNLPLAFPKPMSRLSYEKNTYWATGDYLLLARGRRIVVLPHRQKDVKNREQKLEEHLSNSDDPELREAGELRRLYFSRQNQKWGRKRQTWLFFDTPFKGGDNAEYLYRYCARQPDFIRKYYVLREDVPDWERLTKAHFKLLKYGSLEHRLAFLESTAVMATHCNAPLYNGFSSKVEPYFRDLYHYDCFCITHGLTVQKIPQYQNRIVDNTRLYFLAAPVEAENINNGLYDYQGRDILRLTGHARYDGLKNNDQKNILITPTWRAYLAQPNQLGQARGYFSLFKDSIYYKIYNSLIHNQQLIETAQRTGYSITYLLHPITSAQKEDFDSNGYVKVVAATDDVSYEKLLTQASLMVTDYSGVQFDFAYMYKPVVYYHHPMLPPSYDEGAYRYEEQALGEIVHEEKALVELLCQYMNNGCAMKEEYRQRVDRFFAHHDHRNSRRIYRAIRDYYRKKPKA